MGHEHIETLDLIDRCSCARPRRISACASMTPPPPREPAGRGIRRDGVGVTVVAGRYARALPLVLCGLSVAMPQDFGVARQVGFHWLGRAAARGGRNETSIHTRLAFKLGIGCKFRSDACCRARVRCGLKLPQDIEFKGPFTGPPQTVVVYGDPTKPGVFVSRVNSQRVGRIRPTGTLMRFGRPLFSPALSTSAPARNGTKARSRRTRPERSTRSHRRHRTTHGQKTVKSSSKSLALALREDFRQEIERQLAASMKGRPSWRPPNASVPFAVPTETRLYNAHTMRW